MPRYWHGGPEAVDPTKFYPVSADEEQKKGIAEQVKKHHPITAPHEKSVVVIDGQLCLKRPPAFCPQDQQGQLIQKYEKWVPGSIAFGLLGYGFWVVPPGGHIDLDVSVPESAVKGAAPHLLTEAEYQKLLMAKDDPKPEEVKVEVKSEPKADVDKPKKKEKVEFSDLKAKE